VTLVSATRDLMSRRLGDEIGALFSQKHSRHGVHAVLGRTVAQIDGAKGDFRVLLDDGSELHGDVVVIGIGAVPNVEWLEDSGLEIDDGLVCDEFLT
ncbi:FAD-dependent oxidoreductase, partial [Streptomyces galilaeus]